MYDPDENDYERLQNQWNPEDPGIIMEKRYNMISDVKNLMLNMYDTISNVEI